MEEQLFFRRDHDPNQAQYSCTQGDVQVNLYDLIAKSDKDQGLVKRMSNLIEEVKWNDSKA